MAARYLQIVGCEDETDLRTVSARTTFLRRTDRKYKMKDLSAVCYTNRLRTRFRLVVKMKGLLLMCVPEVDDKQKYSTYLRISETLTRLGGLSTAIVKLDELKDFTKERITTQQNRKKSRTA